MENWGSGGRSGGGGGGGGDWNPVAKSLTRKEERSRGLGDGSAGSELGRIGRRVNRRNGMIEIGWNEHRNRQSRIMVQ
jgi:hypothetical protein